MSGTFPTLPRPASMTVGSAQPTLLSTAHSLKRSVRSRGGQRWSFKLSYVNRTRAELAPLFAFALAQRGQYGAFAFVPPIVGQRQASGGGAPTLRSATASGRVVPVQGVAANATLGRAGDFVKFANGTKVYMLTADAVANGSGQLDLAIEPALYQSVALGEAVVLDNVPFAVAFGADTHEIPVQPGAICSWECSLIEVLP